MTDLEQKKEYTEQEIVEDEMQAVTGGKQETTGDIVIGSIAGAGVVTTVGGIIYTLRRGNNAVQQSGKVVKPGRIMLPK